MFGSEYWKLGQTLCTFTCFAIKHLPTSKVWQLVNAAQAKLFSNYGTWAPSSGTPWYLMVSWYLVSEVFNAASMLLLAPCVCLFYRETYFTKGT